MRRVFALLLLTPFLANCADSATPVASAPAGAVRSEADAPAEGEWPVEENWWTPGDAIEFAEEEMSVQSADVSATAATPKPTVMVLGNPDAGTPYLPGVHDQSVHAKDRIIPGTVVIKAGELVTFQGVLSHRMAIYNDGMKPEDVLNTNPGAFVLYPYNRLYLQPTAVPQVTLKFVRPGKFLIICAIKSHFFNRNMWGWVIVQ